MIPERLAAALADLDRSGDFAASGVLVCPMPALEVEGVGQIAMPVLPFQASQLVLASEPAPYGRGADTIVDSNVRRTRQIDASRVHITDGVWPGTLDTIVARAAAGLGATEVRAELYKLLLYEPGDFFAPHRDTEKVPGMFATLVVSLPSRHGGGALLVRHGRSEERIDLANADVTRVTWAAFYADCAHEIEPITDGHRVCLVYNLVRAGERLVPPDFAAETDAVAEVLRDWEEDDDGPTKLLYVLEHHYTEEGLAFAGLKNGDAAAAEVLERATAECGFELHLAMISIHESGSAEAHYGGYGRWGRREERDDVEFEVGEVHESSHTVGHWRTPADEASVLPAVPWTEDEVSPPGALDDLTPDEQYFTEATGNEGGSFERTYRRAALVLWPRSRRLDVALQAGRAYSVGLLEHLDPPDALALADAIAESWPEEYGEPALAGRLLEAMARLGATDAAVWFIGAKIGRPSWHVAVNPGIAACWRALDRAAILPALQALVDRAARGSPAACVDLLVRLADGPDPGIRGLAERAVATLPAGAPAWNDPVVAPDVLAALLRALSQLQAGDLAERAVAHVLAEPRRYPMDGTVVEAAVLLADGHPVEGLLAAARAWLDARIALPLAPPADWRREPKVSCKCAHCTSLVRFLADPATDRWTLKAAQDIRRHVEDQAKDADLSFTVLKQGSPHTLVGTKNQRTYERLAAQRKRDLEARARLVPR